MTVHVAEPRRFVSVVLAIVFVVALIAIMVAVTGSDPVSVGRS